MPAVGRRRGANVRRKTRAAPLDLGGALEVIGARPGKMGSAKKCLTEKLAVKVERRRSWRRRMRRRRSGETADLEQQKERKKNCTALNMNEK